MENFNKGDLTYPRNLVKQEEISPDLIENLVSNKNEWTKIERGTIEDAMQKLKELNENLSEGEIPWRLPTEDEIIQLFHDNSDTGTRKSDIMKMGMNENLHNPVGGDSWYESDRFFATSNKDVTKIITPYYSKFSVYRGGGAYWKEDIRVDGLENFYSENSAIILTREKVKGEAK